MPLTRNDSEERGSIATRMSLRNVDDFTVYATKPTTFTAGPRMLLPVQGHQVYENPTYVFNTGKVSRTTGVDNLGGCCCWRSPYPGSCEGLFCGAVGFVRYYFAELV